MIRKYYYIKLKQFYREKSQINRLIQNNLNLQLDNFTLTLNYAICQLVKKENHKKLSPKESKLLRMLAIHKNDLMPRELALTKIWRDDNYFTSRSMDVYIAKLRKYLKSDDGVEILNIHGEGFRLLEKS